MSGRESTLTFEDKLADDTPGGVVGSTMQGRIKVDNTLAERLKILEENVSACTGTAVGVVLMCIRDRCCQS
jgi:vacuolar-type H+-ATPase subunit E/Vma4